LLYPAECILFLEDKIKTKIGIYIGIVVLVILLVMGSYSLFFSNPYQFRGTGPIKIFYLSSYMPGFAWSDDNINSFAGYFEKEGIPIEINKFYMNVFDSTVNQTLAGIQAKEAIDAWQPDLIYATDDEAQLEVISKYYLNSKTPVVFSAVNLDPEDYGYDKAHNVAGVLEKEQFKIAVDYLKQFFPNVKKIAVMADSLEQWDVVMDRFKQESQEIPDVEFVGYRRFSSVDEYRQAVLDYQDEVDALMLLPPNAIRYSNGTLNTQAEAVRWVVENSRIPEITFWGQLVYLGDFAAVYISPFEQGEVSARIAKAILIDGKAPSSFPFEATKQNIKYINLARAKMLGLEKSDIPSTILVNAITVETFPWDEDK
jgi:ABC-type uncharacterized transport system substrate-binding protein